MTTNGISKIGLVDDHIIFQKSLAALVKSHDKFEVTLMAGNGLELIEKMEDVDNRPEILLLDLKMPEMDGIECLDVLGERYPETKSIILSMFDQSPFIHHAIKKGARGYLIKDSDPDDLFKALESVRDTGYYINHQLSKVIVEGISKKQTLVLNPVDLITPVEFEVLQHICQGETAQEIGEKIYRSKRTIEGHKQSLLEKTGSKNTAALVAWAFREGLVH